MSTNQESMTEETSSAQASTATPKVSAPATDEHAPAKPPLFWMIVPLILIGLAIYLAR